MKNNKTILAEMVLLAGIDMDPARLRQLRESIDEKEDLFDQGDDVTDVASEEGDDFDDFDEASTDEGGVTVTLTQDILDALGVEAGADPAEVLSALKTAVCGDGECGEGETDDIDFSDGDSELDDYSDDDFGDISGEQSPAPKRGIGR